MDKNNKDKNNKKLTRRTKKKKSPSCILTADWHIRPDMPECRTDNFLEEQEKKVLFIVDLAKKHKCPILIAGDIGNKSQWPNWLLRWFAWAIKEVDVIAIPGQHDLPNHRIDELDRSAQGVLSITDVVDLRTKVFASKEKDFVLVSYPFSQPLKHHFPKHIDKILPTIAMTHQMIIKEKLWPDQVAPKGNVILKKYPEYDLILSGDNHEPFVFEYKNRLLVNPGSLMRTTAAQINHKPRVYLWYAQTNKVKPIFIPIKKGVVSRDHIEQKEEIDERRNVYVKRMKTNYEIGFSYEENLKKHIGKNKVNKNVEERIWEMIE